MLLISADILLGEHLAKIAETLSVVKTESVDSAVMAARFEEEVIHLRARCVP
jgi:hypothetical protein